MEYRNPHADVENEHLEMHDATAYHDPGCCVVERDGPDEYRLAVYSDDDELHRFRVERIMLNGVMIDLEPGSKLALTPCDVQIDQPIEGPGDYGWVYVD